MPDVRLLVAGRQYAGWKTARITRGIEAVAGSFELSVSERWGGQGQPWPIAEEDECSLSIDGTTVITGYVDRRRPSFGPEDHALTVAGRDRTGDLVDCSAVLDEWEFLSVPVLTLAKRIAKPFGISVSLQLGVIPPVPAKLTVNPGDSAFEVIERACRMAGLLPVSDGAGGLLLTRAGFARAVTELVEGQNILSASGEFDATGRFRRYIVSGQHPGTDDWYGEGTAGVKGEAHDLNVRRAARVLMIRAEGSATQETAKRRAEWEATVRAARADAVTVTVQGWKQGNGTLWPVNALTRVRSPLLGIDADMLISQAVHGIDDTGGTTTTLSLKPPGAFKPEPVIAKATKGGVGSALWKEIARGA